MKPWIQSKLVWVGLLQIAIAGLQLYTATDWMDPAAFATFATGMLTIILRFVTDETITAPVSILNRLRPKTVARYYRNNED